MSWEAACPADLDFAEHKAPRLSGAKQTGWAEGRARPRLSVFTRPVFASISQLPGISVVLCVDRGSEQKTQVCACTHRDMNTHKQAHTHRYSAYRRAHRQMHVHTETCPCLHPRTEACSHRDTCAHLCTCMHVCAQVCTHRHACTHSSGTQMHTCPHSHVHAYSHIHKHIYTYSFLHTCTCLRWQAWP